MKIFFWIIKSPTASVMISTCEKNVIIFFVFKRFFNYSQLYALVCVIQDVLHFSHAFDNFIFCEVNQG